MANVSLYLNKSKIDKKGQVPIMLQFDHKNERFRYYTGEKIDPKFWSKSKSSFIKPSYNDDSTLDNYLKGLVSKIKKIARDAKTDNKPVTADYIKRKFLEETNQFTENTFLSLFDKYTKVSESTKTTGTIKNYKVVLKSLKDFSTNNNISLNFSSINNSFYDEFVEYLITKKELSNNTVGKHIKTLKSFLNWATDNEFNRNLEYQKFKVTRENIEIIYLTDQELNTLYNLEISDSELDRSRDLFCFGCFTGLRFSDIAALDNSNINDNEINLRTQKTREILTIPLIPRALAILKKYNNKLPVITNQKLNLDLKTLAEMAKINEPITIQRYRGATRTDIKTPKHKLITTHTARRTFITLSLEKGIRPEVVMSITGHKDYKTFKAYIKITDSIKRESLRSAWK